MEKFVDIGLPWQVRTILIVGSYTTSRRIKRAGHYLRSRHNPTISAITMW